jgi:hypothetical protein
MSAEQIGLAYFVYSVLCAGAGGFVASLKGRNVAQWVLLSFLLGVIGILIVASLAEKDSSGNVSDSTGHGSKVKCKECGKYWHAQALKDGICTVCHRRRLNLKLKRPSHPA